MDEARSRGSAAGKTRSGKAIAQMDEQLAGMDDRVLAARMAAGDEQALAVLYDRYATPAFSLALKHGGDPERAADIVQRAFQRVWMDASRFDAQSGRFRAWLLSIVNYLAAAPAPATPDVERGRSILRQTHRLQPVPVRVSCRRD